MADREHRARHREAPPPLARAVLAVGLGARTIIVLRLRNSLGRWCLAPTHAVTRTRAAVAAPRPRSRPAQRSSPALRAPDGRPRTPSAPSASPPALRAPDGRARTPRA